MENLVMMEYFEWYLPDDGNYYKELKSKAREIKESGIDALWLPPMTKATGTNDVGYGIYDLYDLGEFDQKGNVRTKYGTFDELIEAIDALHNEGILVYADVVLNHKAGADFKETFMAAKVNEENRTEDIEEAHDIEGWTGFDFPGRGGEYSDFIWHFNHFNGVDFDDKTGEAGIYRILGENKGWGYGVSPEHGNFDYLMFADIDHNNEDVRNELFRWGEWFIKKVPIDGIRFDALKHIDYNFIRDFIAHLNEKSDRELYFFGEYWMLDSELKRNYLEETGYLTDVFDTTLHFNLREASENKEYDMRNIFQGTMVYESPANAVTFVDNHDTQPKEALESFVQPWFKKIAYGLILLRKDGYPCVFYGDYYEIKDPYIPGNKDIIDNLLWIRKNYAYGDETNYFEKPTCIGFVRHGNEKHPGSLAVVISTGDADTLVMNVGADQAGKVYKDLTGENEAEITIDEEGNGAFEVAPGSLSAWAEKLD